jgi:hypothetical protein
MVSFSSLRGTSRSNPKAGKVRKVSLFSILSDRYISHQNETRVIIRPITNLTVALLAADNLIAS